jgi:hypothetical protein
VEDTLHEDGEEGEVTPPPHYPLPNDLPHLVTSSAGKWGFPSVHASQNGPG